MDVAAVALAPAAAQEKEWAVAVVPAPAAAALADAAAASPSEGNPGQRRRARAASGGWPARSGAHLADPLHSLLLHPLQLLRGVSLFFPLHWLSPPSANRPLSLRAGSSWISCMMRMASSTFLARRGESSGRIARSRSMFGLERERACIVR